MLVCIPHLMEMSLKLLQLNMRQRCAFCCGRKRLRAQMPPTSTVEPQHVKYKNSAKRNSAAPKDGKEISDPNEYEAVTVDIGPRVDKSSRALFPTTNEWLTLYETDR
jgi:hypothetical protein